MASKLLAQRSISSCALASHQSCSQWLWNPSLCSQYRFVSSKVRIPKPRSYGRRLLDNVTTPFVPEERLPRSQLCRERTEMREQRLARLKELNEVEMAYSAYIQTQVMNAGLLAVVQVFSSANYPKTLNTHAMIGEGLYFKSHSNKIMRHLIKGTRLAELEPLFTGWTGIIVAKDPNSIKSLATFEKRIPWFKVLAVVLDQSRILSVREYEALAALPLLDVLPSQTLSVLHGAVGRLTQQLDTPAHQLTALLDAYAATNTESEGANTE